MRNLWVILILCFVQVLSSNVYAGPSGIDYVIIHHRTYENGDEPNLLFFGLVDEFGDPAEYVVESIKLYNPEGVELSVPVLNSQNFSSLSGRYESDLGQWSYDQNFISEPTYFAIIEGGLTPGTYNLSVVVDGQRFDRSLDYNGMHELPIISSNTFQKHFDENGNLFLRWKAPLYIESGLSTSVRVYFDIYDGTTYPDQDSMTFPDQYLFVKVPSQLESLFVPAEIMNILLSKGNKLNVYMHMRTNDNNNRSYSNEIVLDQIPGFSDFDVNHDGKTGLAEAIHALRITAGVNP